MRYLSFLILVCTALVFGGAVPAAAQAVPTDRSLAVGADVGIFVPGNDLDSSLTLDGFGEVFVTPRVSIRGLVGWTSPGISGREDTHLRQNRLQFNVLHNWERGEWHPFVTAGGGLYFVTLTREGREDDEGDTRGGFNFGGGVEYFPSTTYSWRAEAAYHVIDDGGQEVSPSGLMLAAGIKLYF